VANARLVERRDLLGTRGAGFIGKRGKYKRHKVLRSRKRIL
jgi:hypothetical protein